MKLTIAVCSLFTLLVLAMSQVTAGDTSQAELEAKAKITKAEAEKIALAQVKNGTVKESELEDEDGLFVWCVDISTPDSKDDTEVLVDAKTGKVVSQKKEASGDKENEEKDNDQEDKD